MMSGAELRPDIKKAIETVDTTGWKRVSLEFGRNSMEISVPPTCVELGMREGPVLSDLGAAIEQAFGEPIGSPRLEEMIRSKEKAPAEMSAAIAVSDITRPVPYKGEKGILMPLLNRLH